MTAPRWNPVPATASLLGVLLGACAPPGELRIGAIEDRRRLPGGVGTDSALISDTPVADGARAAVLDALRGDTFRIAGRHVRPRLIVRYASTPEEAAAAAVSLINTDSVQVILSPVTSRLSLPVAVVCDGARIPMLSALSSATALTEGRRWVFRLSAGNRALAEATARFVKRRLGAHRVAVLFDPTTSYTMELGEEYARAATRDGLDVALRQEIGPDLDERQLADLARRVAAARPDLLLVGAELGERDRLLRALLAAGVAVPAVGPDSWYATSSPAGTTTYRVGTEYVADDVARGRTRAHIAALLGRRPSEASLWTYGTTEILLAAARNARSTAPADLRTALIDLPARQTAVGTIDFLADGTTAPRLYLYRAERQPGAPLDSMVAHSLVAVP